MEKLRYNCGSSQDWCRLHEVVQQTSEFLYTLKEWFKNVKFLSFIAKQQHDYFEQRQKIWPVQIWVICDFVENYSFISQKEVQSSHWDLSMMISYKDDNELKSSWHVIISENLKHSTTNVYHFHRQPIQFLKDNKQIYSTAKKKYLFFID